MKCYVIRRVNGSFESRTRPIVFSLSLVPTYIKQLTLVEISLSLSLEHKKNTKYFYD